MSETPPLIAKHAREKWDTDGLEAHWSPLITHNSPLDEQSLPRLRSSH